ncbi:MAG: hypothetical protein K5751_01970 [Treponemataceae bacterium]|nr:hypothetical protein [Treponemataceae bacterium]
MKKNVVVVTVLLIAVLLACVGCSSEPKLQGTFVSEDGSETFVFDGNGNVTMIGSYGSENGTYTVSGFKITVVIQGFSFTATWAENTITDDDTGDVFTKQ